ncbi:S-layer protein [uncultured Methanoregula sp.]|uniref:COG1361 S-layer family protein n=1 Tax=uncultured Methanoregula sp. TaxID=1005933 RepID=UPI002AAB9519|nr:S-layer protein [uncultured Methanoregula sp.]
MTLSSFFMGRRISIALIALVLCTVAVLPASAATKYMGGSPEFSATVSGVNDFSPGQEATVQVLIMNSGLSSLKQLDHGTIDPEDLPTTAKQVIVGLASGSSDIIIKTDPQMIGDIPGNGSPVTLKFTAKISESATSGEYQLPLTIRYIYLRPIEQETGDTFQFTYNKAEDTLPLEIRIHPKVRVEVLEETSDPLTPGAEGYLTLKIKNSGPENGRMVSAKIIRSGKSSVIPTDGSVFIGDFISGGVAECRYKVSIAKDALNKTYPLDVAVTYTDREGVQVTSQPVTIGIPVYGKTTFTVLSSSPALVPGSTTTLEVQYRNDGVATVYNAQARLTGHAPVETSENTVFLGNIRPGESATARYELKTDSTANGSSAKEFTFDSKIRFRDVLGNSIESDTIPVGVRVSQANQGTFWGIPMTLLFFIGIIAIIGAGAVLWYYHRAVKMR